MSSSQHSSKLKSEGSPSLFLGTSSKGSSRVSLPSVITPDENLSHEGGHPLGRFLTNRSTRDLNSSRIDGTSDTLGASSLLSPTTAQSNVASAGDPRSTSNDFRSSTSPFARHHTRAEVSNQREVDRTDALWAEMQATLEEVELSASTGTHLFGPSHSQTLDDLRTAQIALAQAWTRSQADEEALEEIEEADERSRRGSKTSEASENKKDELDKDAEQDLLLAKRRREANDRYFDRVNRSVLEVAQKLEEVATAMRGVERQSREIWDDSSEVQTTASSPDSV